jgi:hypothetical protein
VKGVFLPIIEKGKKPFALLEDLRIEHGDRVFKPFSYPSLDALAAAPEVKIIKPDARAGVTNDPPLLVCLPATS